MSEEEEIIVIVPVLVVRAVEGKVEDVKIIQDKGLEEVLKEYTKKAVDEWDPTLSDFTVMKTMYEIRYKLPISPDLYDVFTALELPMKRSGNEIYVEIPVYTVSFDNRWSEGAYRDIKVYVITYYFDEDMKKQIIEYAAETTAREKRLEQPLELSEEQLRRLEEGLEEAERLEAEEEEEKPRKRSRGRRKKS